MSGARERGLKIEAVADRCGEVIAGLSQVIVGKAEVLEQILAGVLANGHILIEDYPGLAKTLIARLVAAILGLGFKRIQFTPDLLPSDITGSFLFDQRQGRFEFRRGPIFTHLLLADEINRATPKTQSALLEAMQEAQVTIEGERFPLEPPFLVIATQNPIELEGTYPLPEAQLDRFLLRLAVGYPEADEEAEILARRRRQRDDAISVTPVTSRSELLLMQKSLEDVHVADVTERYIVDLVRATRADHRVALGASPRGSLALLKLARALAALRRRDFVLPDDVKAMAVPALAHRIILKPELWASRVSAAQVVQGLLAQVPVPGPETPGPGG
jgi:MoxR-like ATPase